MYFTIFSILKISISTKEKSCFYASTTEDLPKDFIFNEKVVIDNFKSIKSSLLKTKTTLDVLGKEVEENIIFLKH